MQGSIQPNHASKRCEIGSQVRNTRSLSKFRTYGSSGRPDQHNETGQFREKLVRKLRRLTIDGLVESSVTLDWQKLQSLPQSDSVSDIHCVTAWSRYDNRWRGILVSDLLALARQ